MSSSVDSADSRSLATSLRLLLEERGLCRGSLVVIERGRNVKSSSSASEIVTCRVDDGRELRILCKHEAVRAAGLSGHWRGVRYESEVYRRVLEPLGATVTKVYGTYVDPTTGRSVLALEYLEDALPGASLGLRESGVASAAAWIGAFHRATEGGLPEASAEFLQKFDEEFYRGWARRALLFATELDEPYPWLPALCRHFERLAGLLAAGPAPVIHAEFYRENILVRRGVVYPIDWESAAIGAGEIDLAALSEGWAPPVAHGSESAYVAARWPQGPPGNFIERLEAARLYLHFRWLGDRPRSVRAQGSRWRFRQLLLAAERLGLAERRASDGLE